MNKKQLIVGWATTATLCFIILFAPQKHIKNNQGFITVYEKPEYIGSMCVTAPKIFWDFVLQRSLIVLLIGSLLVYTLKDKNK